MRIAIPFQTPPDSFSDNVTHTLREMGHEVRTMPARSNKRINAPWRPYVSSLMDRLSPDRTTREEAWLLRTVREWRPTVVLALTQQLSDAVLAETRRLGVSARIAWWGDSPANMRGKGLLSREWDRIYLKDPLGVEKLCRVGLPAELLHEACNPSWHRPLTSRANDDVAIAGTFYEYRHFLTELLLDAKVPVALYGGRLPRWASKRIRSQHTGRFIVRDEKSRVFGEARACLNSTSLREGNSINCRAFEIAAAGGFQVLEHRPLISECFEPGREVATFDTFDGLLDLLARADREPSWAQGIRDAGARRAHGEHTYRHRLTHILQELG